MVRLCVCVCAREKKRKVLEWKDLKKRNSHNIYKLFIKGKELTKLLQSCAADCEGGIKGTR